RKNNHDFPLAQFWNGTSWSLGKQPALPSGASNTFLQAVSCVSAKSCVATGNYYVPSNSGDSIALAESWNGSSWKAFRPPTPSTIFSYLDTISCVTTSYCLAGGTYYAPDRTGARLLADRWDGSSWHQASVAQPTPAKGWPNEIDG